MKPGKSKKDKEKDLHSITPDPTSGKDIDNDHSGTDTDADNTETGKDKPGKFDKPKREADPDTTGIDTDADKTKPNNKSSKNKKNYGKFE
jgi:hypothetical protein